MGPIRPYQGGGYPQQQQSPQQAVSAPPNTGASVVAGISNFLTNFKAARDQDKQQNAQAFYQDVQAMMLGVPVDQKKMAKKAKAAGLDLDFEGPTAQQQQVQQQNFQEGSQQVQDANQQATAQMMMRQPPQATMGAPAGQQPIPQRPDPSFMQRVGQAMGIDRRPIDLQNSSGGQWLQQLSQMGKKNSELASSELTQKIAEQHVKPAMLDLFKRAIGGDPQALDMATRLPEPFNLKSQPFDHILRLGDMQGVPREQTAKAVMFSVLGGPAALQNQREMAQKFAEYFDNDLGQASQYIQDIYSKGRSDLDPGMSLEQQVKISDYTDRLAAKYPTAPINLLRTYALNEFTGKKADARKLLDYLSSNFKREGTISGEQFDVNDKNHKATLAQSAWIHSEQIALQRQKAVLDAAGEEGQTAQLLMKSDDPTTKNAGYKMLADALNMKGEVSMTFNDWQGKKKTVPAFSGKISADTISKWFGIRADQNTLSFLGSKGGVDQFVGGAAGKPSPEGGISQTLKQMMDSTKKYVEQQLLGLPSEN